MRKVIQRDLTRTPPDRSQKPLMHVVICTLFFLVSEYVHVVQELKRASQPYQTGARQ